MQRAPILALSALVATFAVACGKKEAPAAAPPEVFVADVVQKDVPVYLELVGQTRGSQDVESGLASRGTSRRWPSPRAPS